jgi:hypothetical protein
MLERTNLLGALVTVVFYVSAIFVFIWVQLLSSTSTDFPQKIDMVMKTLSPFAKDWQENLGRF